MLQERAFKRVAASLVITICVCYILVEPIKVNPGKPGDAKLQTYVVRKPGRPSVIGILSQ